MLVFCGFNIFRGFRSTGGQNFRFPKRLYVRLSHPSRDQLVYWIYLTLISLILQSIGHSGYIENLWAVLVWAVIVYGPFLTYEWAVLDVAVGRFVPGYGPFLPFVWAVLVHGPFWYRPPGVGLFPNWILGFRNWGTVYKPDGLLSSSQRC